MWEGQNGQSYKVAKMKGNQNVDERLMEIRAGAISSPIRQNPCKR